MRPVTAGQDFVRRLESAVTEFTLSNGLRFIVLERHIAPVVSCHTYVNVGAFDEDDGKTGDHGTVSSNSGTAGTFSACLPLRVVHPAFRKAVGSTIGPPLTVVVAGGLETENEASKQPVVCTGSTPLLVLIA